MPGWIISRIGEPAVWVASSGYQRVSFNQGPVPKWARGLYLLPGLPEPPALLGLPREGSGEIMKTTSSECQVVQMPRYREVALWCLPLKW